MLRLYNTLTKQKEDFSPIHDGHVGMYNCGPTVYDDVHIGNLRSFFMADILRRVLEYNDYGVMQVMNITDVGHLSGSEVTEGGEDKMTKGLEREGKELTLENMRWLAGKYTESFEQDLRLLNIQHPSKLPRASDHIDEQIELIKKLEEAGFTYLTSDGVYFDTTKYPDYGKLGGLTPTDEAESRIAKNKEKRGPRDFILWKLNQSLGWDSPWGKGFPGWHIECSAMSMKYLGESFDIHTGGIDNKPTHHNNELAQSESATGKPLARFWLHGEHVNLEGGLKMAKSEGTGLTLKTLEEHGYDPLAYRYWLLTAHYRSPITFTWEALTAAQNALQKLKNRVLGLGKALGTPDPIYVEKFKSALNNDLGTPEALALLWDLLKDASAHSQDKKATVLHFDKVLALGLDSIKAEEIPQEIQELLAKRDGARTNNDWAKADELRAEIEKHGYTVKDNDGDTQVTRTSGLL